MQYPEVQLLPVNELTSSEINYRAVELFELVSDREVSRHLTAMHLLGVVERHTVSPVHSAELLKEQQQMMSSDEMRSYLAVDPQCSDRLVGRVSIDPTIELRIQAYPIWPKVARMLPFMSGKMLVSETGANATAWLDPRREEHLNDSIDAISKLGALAAGISLWNIVPHKFAVTDPYYDMAMRQGGFTAMEQPAYLEDNEKIDKWVPLSTLYIRA